MLVFESQSICLSGVEQVGAEHPEAERFLPQHPCAVCRRRIFILAQLENYYLSSLKNMTLMVYFTVRVGPVGVTQSLMHLL